MIVKINLDKTYELLATSADLMEAKFYSYDKKDNWVLIKVLIEPVKVPFLPNLHNLCFGPLKADGSIDDETQISHKDSNKLFSTIILFCLTFLQENPRVTLGLDGSNDARAYLYHRIFLTNREYLEDFFVALGVDWFVRLLRDGDIERHEDGTALFKPKPEPFDHTKPARDLYRYYLLQLD